MKLREKVAVVTGAGSGQGRAVALLFAQEGARVVVGDVNAQGADETVSFIVAAGGKAVATAGDLSKASAAQALVAAALDAYGRLDILYNNAGVFWADRDAPTAELEEHVWDRILDINLKSVYLCCKYALPELIRSRGCIINVSSVAGYAGDKDFHAYPASKGAMLSFTRSLAQKYGPQGVRANVLCPGFIETPMVQFVLD
ncbi:MAG: SDR family oxidoreductase, partial [Planctomycetes bacterium]|nr:SDR family oxidoreductase [Planctomycetota bacterium]